MKIIGYTLQAAVFAVALFGCATVPPPEVEDLTLNIPAYLEDAFNVSYRPANELQYGNMTCLLDQKLTPPNSKQNIAVPCNEARKSGVSISLGWMRKGVIRSDVEMMVIRDIRMRHPIGPLEDSVRDLRICTEEKVESLKEKGVLVRCNVEFFTTQAEYKMAKFSVFYLKPLEGRGFQPFVITEGMFGRGDDEAQRDVILYGEALDWLKCP